MPTTLPLEEAQSSLSEDFSKSNAVFLKLEEVFSKSKDVFARFDDCRPKSEDNNDLFPDFVSDFPVGSLPLRQEKRLVEVSIL